LRLTDLLEGIVETDKDAEITMVTSDSRQAKKGSLFAAFPGNKVKGSDFISDAIMHGASAILMEEGTEIPNDVDVENVVFVKTKNSRKDFAYIVSRFYKLQPSHIVAVTGTSGKTSTVSFVQQLI